MGKRLLRPSPLRTRILHTEVVARLEKKVGAKQSQYFKTCIDNLHNNSVPVVCNIFVVPFGDSEQRRAAVHDLPGTMQIGTVGCISAENKRFYKQQNFNDIINTF